MFPIISTSDLGAEYQARVDTALRKGKPVASAHRVTGPGAWTRLRAWLIARHDERVQQPQPVDSIT
ncbi:MAG TPA: hypothetical protein VLA19_24875 [Herpetosiphonaceae bacterium]|nr:hypothetical protein [Herpetosiphonaceae bacterium]